MWLRGEDCWQIHSPSVWWQHEIMWCCMGSMSLLRLLLMLFHAFETFSVICIFWRLSMPIMAIVVLVMWPVMTVKFKQQPSLTLRWWEQPQQNVLAGMHEKQTMMGCTMSTWWNVFTTTVGCSHSGTVCFYTHTHAHLCMHKPINLALFMTE